MNASIHHEMLTPLAINVELADRLQQQVTSDEHKDMAQVLIVNSKIIMFHVNDLLDSKVIQVGKFVPAKTHQYVGKTIQEITNIISWTLKQSNLEIEFQNTDDHYELLFDKRRLQQVLLNLLSNAIKFQM